MDAYRHVTKSTPFVLERTPQAVKMLMETGLEPKKLKNIHPAVTS